MCLWIVRHCQLQFHPGFPTGRTDFLIFQLQYYLLVDLISLFLSNGRNSQSRLSGTSHPISICPFPLFAMVYLAKGLVSNFRWGLQRDDNCRIHIFWWNHLFAKIFSATILTFLLVFGICLIQDVRCVLIVAFLLWHFVESLGNIEFFVHW